MTHACRPSVQTRAPGADGNQENGLGSGVVIDDRGDILTSLHVVAGATEIQLTFADGSLGSLHYLTSGAPTLAKERLEVHSAGWSAVLDDFRELETHGADGVKRVRSRLGQDKGHRAAVAEFLKAVRQGGPSPIPFAEALNVTLATLAAEASLRLRIPFAVDDVSIRPL